MLEGRQAVDVLVQDLVLALAGGQRPRSGDSGIQGTGRPRHRGVQDQAERTELVLSELAQLIPPTSPVAVMSLKVAVRNSAAQARSGVLRRGALLGRLCQGVRGRETIHRMDDAFTLIRQAVELLPEDAVAENGVTVGDVREDIERQEWEMVLDLLIEIADVHPVHVDFWELLAEAARQMMLDRSRRWCEWRGWEVQHGTVRATLSLVEAEEGGRQSASHSRMRSVTSSMPRPWSIFGQRPRFPITAQTLPRGPKQSASSGQAGRRISAWFPFWRRVQRTHWRRNRAGPRPAGTPEDPAPCLAWHRSTAATGHPRQGIGMLARSQGRHRGEAVY